MIVIYQQPLPKPYPELSPDELTHRILRAKEKLGKKVVILTHHYQRPEIVTLGDLKGDSLQLARFAATQSDATYIIFCGVHFMAESADILKLGQQSVILPDLGAGCDMADMADVDDVERAWEEAVNILNHADIMPITYVNSSAALKAFVGSKNGIVCTSSNAHKVIEWARAQKKLLFFYPDQHLGRNTMKRMGIALEYMPLWNPKKIYGGLSEKQIKNAQAFLWEGCCPVHQLFTSKQIDIIRAKDSSFKIISHPECMMEVVDKSDIVGSTDLIVRTIAESPAGSKWAVGTELNLVTRIIKENPDKTVISINPFMCLCGTMNRIDLQHLAWSLEQIIAGSPQNIISVKEPIRTLAKEALVRMLNLSL